MSAKIVLTGGAEFEVDADARQLVESLSQSTSQFTEVQKDGEIVYLHRSAIAYVKPMKATTREGPLFEWVA